VNVLINSVFHKIIKFLEWLSKCCLFKKASCRYLFSQLVYGEQNRSILYSNVVFQHAVACHFLHFLVMKAVLHTAQFQKQTLH
jgi:hypothetical protein